ncbi:hypothetical protein AB0I01_06640, partial [Streptomyces sp. NPDC050848]
EEKDRMTLTGVGGAFGGREDLSMQIHASLLARGTADAHAAALLGAAPEYARLLASVAASGAAHAYLLTDGGRA